MTDKQIIECKYKFQSIEKFAGKPYCTLHNETCEFINFVCDKNCQVYEDYKQLKRKEQECEELKENLPNAITRLMGKLDQLKAENNELKKQLESTKGLVTIGNKQLMEALFELQKQQHENCHFDKIKELTKEM